MIDLTLAQKIVIWALPLVFAITLHEVAHGWVAWCFGDYTAKLSGRLSLNPIRHIDPVGTIALPLLMLLFSNFIFGWAKPVPVDPRNMRHPRRDMAFVALAGPLSNIVMALAWGAIAKCGIVMSQMGYAWLGVPLNYMGDAGIMINVVIGVLNLVPIPPLDGGRVLAAILPRRLAYRYGLLEPYGFVILIILLFTGLLNTIIGLPIVYLISTIGGLFGLA